MLLQVLDFANSLKQDYYGINYYINEPRLIRL